MATVDAAPEAERPIRAQPPPRVRRVNVQDLLEMANRPVGPPEKKGSSSLGKVAAVLLGGTVRFVLGAVLLAVALVWAQVRDLVPGASNVDAAATWADLWERAEQSAPLEVPGAPDELLRVFCNLNALVAGALLVVSALWRSPKMGLFLLPAAVLMCLGPFLPALALPVGPQLAALMVGVALALLGFLFGRDT
jgi:hypothetical protein